MIEDVEDFVDDLADLYFSKSTSIVLDVIDHDKASVLPSSILLT